MKSKESEKIAKTMKAAREAAGLGTTELARELKMDKKHIYNWEQGVFIPNTVNFIRYMEACGKKIIIN